MFKKDGSTTAGIMRFDHIIHLEEDSMLLLVIILWCVGNSSQVSDGAGAVLLMKRSVALQKGLPILGVFRHKSQDLF